MSVIKTKDGWLPMRDHGLTKVEVLEQAIPWNGQAEGRNRKIIQVPRIFKKFAMDVDGIMRRLAEKVHVCWPTPCGNKACNSCYDHNS